MELTPIQREEVLRLYRGILKTVGTQLSPSDVRLFHETLKKIAEKQAMQKPDEARVDYVLEPILRDLNTIYLCVTEIGLGRATVFSVLLFHALTVGVVTLEEIEKNFDASIYRIVRGLFKVSELYQRTVAIETENFRKLMLSFSEDVRVVFILIADRVFAMRNLQLYSQEEQQKIAREASYLYAPLAHRMGLYKLKTELEDLSLRSISPEIYYDIENKLKETQDAREKYIADFIGPLKQQLHDAGFTFSIKGRTKSIYSIWNKIKKKNTPFENIYDLFAIRVILDSPLEKEKADCWQVYSIVTDKYQPNPKRMRDWLSIPKSNGYESLHTTVMGPEGKWVEVQIRTKRMDEIAEKGLAAHWKYKGIKGEAEMDEWLKNIREILENPEKNAVDFIDDFKLDLYDDEVFVFTPTGELKKLRQGATVLDFAFLIHTNVGSKCIGARINGKNVSMRYVLNNGDQVEVLTSANQVPKQEWLNIVVTAKAKTKVKQALRDMFYKDAEAGKEMLLRRLKNWKIEYEDADIMRLSSQFGFKAVSDFYCAIFQEKIDLQEIRSSFEKIEEPLLRDENRTADNYEKVIPVATNDKEDVLVIDQNLKGIDYTLAKCCNPIYGDDVFGFVSSAGGIKIHRKDCPNAPQMINRFGYRVVKARWSGKAGSQYPISLRIVGRDDISIVTNVTSLISKEKNIILRSISVDSADGIFQGNVTIMVPDTANLEILIKKIRAISGVTLVERA